MNTSDENDPNFSESQENEATPVEGKAVEGKTKVKAKRKPKAEVVVAEPAGPRNLRAIRSGEARPATTARVMGVETTRITIPAEPREMAPIAEGDMPMFRE